MSNNRVFVHRSGTDRIAISTTDGVLTMTTEELQAGFAAAGLPLKIEVRRVCGVCGERGVFERRGDRLFCPSCKAPDSV